MGLIPFFLSLFFNLFLSFLSLSLSFLIIKYGSMTHTYRNPMSQRFHFPANVVLKEDDNRFAFILRGMEESHFSFFCFFYLPLNDSNYL